MIRKEGNGWFLENWLYMNYYKNKEKLPKGFCILWNILMMLLNPPEIEVAAH